VESGDRVIVGIWKLANHIHRGGAVPIHLFRHFCCRMYHLVTLHSH